MTPLYFDTNVGCTENYTEWTAADEGRKSLTQMIKGLFR